MTFRKESLLFNQGQIAYVVMLLVCLAMIPILGVGLSLIFVSPFVVFILVNPKVYKEYITINEAGISCHKSGKQLWAYDWESIAELKKSRRFRQPSMEVITYNKHGEAEQFALPNHYFQLSRKAKEAIKQYYKPTEH